MLKTQTKSTMLKSKTFKKKLKTWLKRILNLKVKFKIKTLSSKKKEILSRMLKPKWKLSKLSLNLKSLIWLRNLTLFKRNTILKLKKAKRSAKTQLSSKNLKFKTYMIRSRSLKTKHLEITRGSKLRSSNLSKRLSLRTLSTKNLSSSTSLRKRNTSTWSKFFNNLKWSVKKARRKPTKRSKNCMTTTTLNFSKSRTSMSRLDKGRTSKLSNWHREIKSLRCPSKSRLEITKRNSLQSKSNSCNRKKRGSRPLINLNLLMVPKTRLW